MIYLDNNATTEIDPAVLAAMLAVWERGPLNPSSQHAAGRVARGLLDDALQRTAKLLGTDILRTGGSRLLLTSGGTEANNWVLECLVPADLPRWVSASEHPSVLAAGEQLALSGYSLHTLPVDHNGIVQLDALAAQLTAIVPIEADNSTGRQPRGLVSVMMANNETGVLQPLESIVALCQKHRVVVHSDATQFIGKLPFHFDHLGLAAATFTAHKFHGPIGIGGLLLAPGFSLTPRFHGGGQQLATRPGTEAVPLAVGMARALEIAQAAFPESIDRMTKLRDLLEQRLQTAIDDCHVHAQQAPRLPSTSCISFPGVDRQTLMILLDRAGIACGTGSACASGSSEPSHVLQAMRVPAEQTDSAMRFGVSRFSTSQEIELASERIIYCCNKLRSN
ncbi:cysteine desulfurase family protein [Planctomycetaceae bacterium SH139]